MQTSPFLLLLFALIYQTTLAFYVRPPIPRVARNGRLFLTADGGGDSESSFDIEAMRQHLESQYHHHHHHHDNKESTTSNPTLPKPSAPLIANVNVPEPSSPLTSIERERRQAEIGYLKLLKENDVALPDLWSLWEQERGAAAAARLAESDALAAHPSSWREAEAILRSLIKEHGVHWPEPVNRLATLCYMQNRLEESEELCKTVLAVRPWHFGALSGIVMVYAGMHKVDQARHWAAHRLPTFSSGGTNRRRDQWVRKAVQDAEDLLEEAEVRLLDSFGEQDRHTLELDGREFADDDPWQ